MASVRLKTLRLRSEESSPMKRRGPMPTAGIGLLISNLKKQIKAKGGDGFIGLQRRFRIMDDDGNKTLSMAEFKKGIKDLKMDLSEVDLRALFEHFDADESGCINFEEFVQGVRDPLTDRRLRLVNMAFRVIDKDDSGVVDAQEIAGMYDASKHPEVMAGRKSSLQVLTEFLGAFEVGGVKDGMVTKQEFTNYYANLGASIDNDDYFELMIRNAWHLSGGEGVGANSTNMRVLVTDSSGNERTVELESDLGVSKTDIPEIYNRLIKQGVKDVMAINGKTLTISTINGKTEVSTVESTPSLSPVNVKLPHLDRLPKVKGIQNSQSQTLLTLQTTHSPAAVLPEKMSPLKKQQLLQRQEHAHTVMVSTLVDVLRVQLLSRGTAGIIELQRKFVDMDTDGSQSLDYAEFKQAVLANKLAFSEDQLRALFSYFDTDGSGTIEYDELLYGLRGSLAPKLLVLVHQVFDLLDKQCVDMIDPQTLISHFDASRHPEVLSRSRTAQAVQSEFLSTFDVGGVVPGMITRDEFVRYYTNIAASVNDDDYFEMVLRSVWHVDRTVKKREKDKGTTSRKVAAQLRQVQNPETHA